MTTSINKYYVSTFPGQNRVELHSRLPGKLEGPIEKIWYSQSRAFEMIRSYGRDIRDIKNCERLRNEEKEAIIDSLEVNMQKYLSRKGSL